MNLGYMYDLLEGKVKSWLEAGVKLLPNLITAIVTLLFFYFLARACKRLADKVLKKISKNQAVDDILEKIIFITVIAIGVFLALGILNLDKTVTSLLAGAGVIGLALGFAFQEIASNFVSGILIAFTEPYQVGDIVEVDNYTGEVIAIQIRTTSIMTFTGLEVIIPNKTMFTKDFTNYTTTPRRRVDLTVGISYGDNLDKVEQVVCKALENVEHRIKQEPIEFFYSEFAGSSINFDVRMWIEYPANGAYLKVKHQMIKNIKKAFDDNDITIPFPIRTLDFGIKGGEKLDSMLTSRETNQ